MLRCVMSLMLIIYLFCFIKCYKSDIGDNTSDNSYGEGRHFVFPQYSIYQIRMCLVAPISAIPDMLRVQVNIGLQINYILPFRLSDFYNPMYWARAMSNVSSPAMYLDEKKTDMKTSRVKRDFTAGQLYSGLKQTFGSTGYHEDCLLKSVCELAKSPLHKHDDDIVHEIMHFVLTPSIHQGFDKTENIEKQLFEEAERFGKTGGDCELVYGSNCHTSPLHAVSHLIQH